MALVLHGYHYSVYLRIVRMVLEEKRLSYERVEVNPFATPVAAEYLALHPFGRVPALVHDGFVLYETSAITRYLDRVFPTPPLQPPEPKAQARMDQIIGIVDWYAYWPLVRQVFGHGVMRPRDGRPFDPAEVTAGLAAAKQVLAALEVLLTGEAFITGPTLSLADLHLAAMMAYFSLNPEGLALLREHPKMSRWWDDMSELRILKATDPGLPEVKAR